MKKLFALLYLALMAVSCSNEDLLATEEANDASTNIKFSIKDFELVTDEPETRTVIENSVTNKVKASWVNGDEIGVFAIADYHVPQTIFPVSKATQRKDNEEGSMSLSFNGNGFYRLIDGQKYIAYYPFQDMMSSKSYDKIPVSFEGQKQTMNNSGSHLGKYDYLCSDVTVANSGMANFVFSHAICVAKFKIRLPENVKITNITLKNINGNKIFVEKGFLDVSTKTILPSSKSVELSMDVADGYKRNTFYSYIAFAPTTLEDYKVIVTAEDGTKYESSVMPKRVMESGKFYYAEVLMTNVN